MIENTDLPLGFAMQLAQNLKSMDRFARMSEQEKKVVIEGAKNIKSHDDMQVYVQSIAK